MTAEARQIHLRLDSDQRLLGAVSIAVAWIAERAGFESAAQADLAAASEEACRDTFPLLSKNAPLLDVGAERFADRVEVTLEHHGAMRPSAGLESFFAGGQGFAGDLSGLSLLARVDRVQYNSESGASKTTLIKYLRPLVSETP